MKWTVLFILGGSEVVCYLDNQHTVDGGSNPGVNKKFSFFSSLTDVPLLTFFFLHTCFNFPHKFSNFCSYLSSKRIVFFLTDSSCQSVSGVCHSKATIYYFRSRFHCVKFDLLFSVFCQSVSLCIVSS